MANGEYEIDEKTFRGMTIKQQNWITFKTFNAYREDTNIRIKKLESRKTVNTVASGIGGFFGGIIAVIGKKVLGL